MNMDHEKPFKCPKCSQCFATSDHLVVHERIHANPNNQSHGLLVKMPVTSVVEHATDKTPTPTRFIKMADVEGSVLFEDINPFEQDFKLASKRNTGLDQSRSHKASISSTSSIHVVCPTQGIPIKPLQRKKGTSVKHFRVNSESEAEVSSTVALEGVLSTDNQSVQVLKSMEKLKDRSTVEQNEISSSTSEDPSRHNMNSNIKKCKVTANSEIIKLHSFPANKPDTTSLPTSSHSSHSSTVQEVVRSTSPSTHPITNVNIEVSTSSMNISSSSLTRSPSSFGKSQTQVSITNDHKQNGQTSLQSFLQQIRGGNGDLAVKSATNSGTQSQEALREQLKSLIKSGQIKIKFTSDPSSPKVQATIVGNITKKTATIPKCTIAQDPVNAQPIISQSVAVPRPTMVQEIQPDVYKVEETLPQENPSNSLIQRSPVSHDASITHTKGQLLEKHASTTQLPQRLQPKLPATIQIIPSHHISKPIHIAPKTSTTDSSNSILISQKNLSPVTDVVTVSTNVSQVQSAGNLVFAKEKLKLAIQHSENALLNGCASRVTSVGSQGKYKDVNFESTSENTIDMITSATTTTTTLNTNEAHGSKRKLQDDFPTDEKRKRFLERNRAAASRCRQKRKIWVNQLASKSDDLVQTNTLLMNEINALRSEVVQLKSLLLAHKDCPVTQQQKALLGQMTPGSYIAAVSDGQIIAIHQIPEGNVQGTKSAEEVASSALTDMAARATMELDSNVTATSDIIQSNTTISTTENS